MSKISIQLHALPSEVASLLHGLLSDTAVCVTVAEGSPIRFRAVENRENDALSGCKAVMFTLSQPELGAASLNEFKRLNPDVLVFEIGHQSSAGLSESWLWAMTENWEAMKRWKLAAKQLQSHTLTGAVAVNPLTGATAPMKGHRFTQGAQASYAHGTPMRPSAGNSVVQLVAVADSSPATPRG
jgi:hypothetical protein